MNNFLVFRVHKAGIFGSYRDIGGWSDLDKTFKTSLIALDYIKKEIENKENRDIQCWQLVDLNQDNVRYFTPRGEWVPYTPVNKLHHD